MTWISLAFGAAIAIAAAWHVAPLAQHHRPLTSHQIALFNGDVGVSPSGYKSKEREEAQQLLNPDRFPLQSAIVFLLGCVAFFFCFGEVSDNRFRDKVLYVVSVCAGLGIIIGGFGIFRWIGN